MSSTKEKAIAALQALATREIRFTYEQIPIRIPRASYKKIFNWLAVEASIVAKSVEPWGLPTYLQLEPTTVCNLACNYCPVSDPANDHVGHLDLELAKRMIDEMSPTALLAVFWGWGEPFLAPGIYDMVRHARANGLQTISSTNGHLFAADERARQLVESGLDTLIISTSGMSPESYAKSRAGKFDTPLQGVRNIAAWKKKLGSSVPFLCLTLIITGDNEHEIDRAKELAAELDIDMLNLKKLNPNTTSTDAALPAEPAFRRLTYGDDGAPIRRKTNPCKAMFHKTTLRWDGRINSCTFDFHGESLLGDFKSTPFREIWRAAAYKGLRRRFRTNWHEIPACSRCGYGYEGATHEDNMIETVRFKTERAPTSRSPDSADPAPPSS